MCSMATKTLITMIIDESSSMTAKLADVLNGFNQFICEQKKIENDIARLYLIKFNSNVSVVHKGIELKDVSELTTQNYRPSGSTALYDAIREGVRLSDETKSADERVVCVIITDGEENVSKLTSLEDVKDIMSKREALEDWTFVYIGVKPDDWAKKTNSSRMNAVSYDEIRPTNSYDRLTSTLSNFRISNRSKFSDLDSRELSR